MADHPKSRLLKPQPEDPNDEYGEWRELLKDIDVTDIPLEMAKVLRVHMTTGEKFVFPISQWSKEGYSSKKIENLINKWHERNENEIDAYDFVVDVERVKEAVTAETNKVLKKL